MELRKRRCAAVIAAAAFAASCAHTAPVTELTELSESELKVSADSPVEQQVQHKEANETQRKEQVPAPAASPAAAVKALSVEDIEFYLKNKVSSKLIAQRIVERGVIFVLNSKVKMRLKKAKADARIFNAINEVSARGHRSP